MILHQQVLLFLLELGTLSMQAVTTSSPTASTALKATQKSAHMSATQMQMQMARLSTQGSGRLGL